MPRGGWQKRWVKFYPIECLEGSIRYQLEAEERGVWYDLIMYSGICANPGVIADKDSRPFPHSFLANRLNVSLELFERTLTKCVDEGRIQENSDGIHIVNFTAYQSEYQRQKPYREAEKETGNDVAYKEDGSIDEHGTLIHHQSLWRVRRILKGEEGATEANKRMYRRILKKLGIPEEEGG